MTNTIRDYLQCLKKNRSKRNRTAAVLVVLSVLVAAGVSWQLHLTGITMSGDAYCGCEEHKHDESCYEQKLVCTTPESDGHTHMDSCYEKVLVCGKEEHVHTLSCFSDSSADVETSETWEATLPALTDDRAENVVAIAQSQLSYHESEHNYKVENEETKKGYTRYGAWYGDPYGDWCAMFASFCIHYAGIDQDTFPYAAEYSAWVGQLNASGLFGGNDSYTPKPGDLVFFDTNGNGEADRVGIVENVSNDSIAVIEGDSGDEVRRNGYSLNEDIITGYGILPENPDHPEKETEKTEAAEENDAESEGDSKNDVTDTKTSWAEVRRADGTAGAGDELMEMSLDDTKASDAVGNDNATSPSPLDNYITDVSVQKLVNGQWTDSTVFTDGDQVKVNFSYKLPTGEVSQSNRVFTYQLPDGVRPNEDLSGDVYCKGADVGNYTIDKETGLITITFDEAFADGTEITGDLYFVGTATRTDDKDESEITFPGSGTTITVKKQNEDADTSDVNVKKDAAVSSDKKTIDYTVEVSTTKGTGKTVDFKDCLSTQYAVYQQGSVKIQKVSGDITTDVTLTDSQKPVFGTDANGNPIFSMTGLDELQAGEKYLITYTVDVTGSDADGRCAIVNSAYANEKKADKWTEVSNSKLSKSGSYDADTGKINWKVTINTNGENLNGYTVSDTMSGIAFAGNATLTSTDTSYVTKTENIRLPYTFGDTSGIQSYVIEYSTDAPTDGSQSVTNNVEVKKDGETGWTAGQTVGVEGRDWNVGKNVSSQTTDSDGNQALTWTSTLQLPSTALNDLETFTYTDTILDSSGGQNADSHYGTKPEIEAKIAESIKFTCVKDGISEDVTGNAIRDYLTYTVTCYDENGNTVTDDAGKVTKFTVSFTPAENVDESISGKKISFQYPTVGVVNPDVLDVAQVYHNHGELKEKQADGSASYTKRPKLYKDASATGYLTEADYTQTADSNGYIGGAGSFSAAQNVVVGEDGVVYYRLVVKPSSDGELTITDTLPDGVTYAEDSGFARYIQLNGATTDTIGGMWAKDYLASGGEHDFRKDGSKAIFTQNGNKLTITVPGGFKVWDDDYHGLVIFYAVKLSDEQMASKDPLTLTNNAVWNENTASTTTTVEKENIVIKKEGGQCTEKKGDTVTYLNAVDYSVIINSNGADLDKDSATLLLTDELSYSNLDDVYLDLNSVKLYYYDASKEGNLGDLMDSSRYQISYDNSTTEKRVMTVTLPDETPCVLVYTYRTDPGTHTDGRISNSAGLAGKNSELKDLEIKVNDSGASAEKNKITVFKVDSKDYSKLLQGAKFELYKATASGWETVSDGLTTDENGELVFATADGDADAKLEMDTIYKLVETEAPAGYAKSDQAIYFDWLSGTNTVDSPYYSASQEIQNEIGEQKNIQQITGGGGAIYVPNEYTQITVKKVWAGEDGGTLDVHPDSVDVRLYRQATQKESCTVTVKFKTEYQDYGSKDFEVKPGTTFALQITGYWSSADITCGEKTMSVTSTDGVLSYRTDEITQDTTITVAGGWDGVWERCTFDYTEGGYVGVGDAVHVNTQTLNDSNNWSYTWTELDKTDDSGNPYYYYIEETVPSGYTASYTNNSGIKTGEIVVTNRKNKVSEYELPKTGGTGTLPYILTGLLIVAGTVVCGYERRRTGRRGNQ